MSQQTDLLIYRCPNCDTEVGVDESLIGELVDCPNKACGKPFRAPAPKGTFVCSDGAPNCDVESDIPSVEIAADNEDELVVRHPAMFRNRPLTHTGLVLAAVLGLAGLIWGMFYGYTLLSIVSTVALVAAACYYTYWFVDTLCTSLIITNRRTILRHGILSKRTNEVQHDDVRNMHVDQTFADRLFGVGRIEVSSSGQDDMEIVVEGIINPTEVSDLIRTYQ